jgi:large subunit ribosomal protein L13
MPGTSLSPPRHRATFQAKKATLKARKASAGAGAHQPEWYVADVEGKTLGRAATRIADVLRGKHRPTFTPHVDAGDFVVVVNADKVKLTKDKWQTKLYYDHSLFPGGLRTQTAFQLNQRHPGDLVRRAVWGMLPKGPLGRRIFKKLKVYAGPSHRHANHQPKVLSVD